MPAMCLACSGRANSSVAKWLEKNDTLNLPFLHINTLFENVNIICVCACVRGWVGGWDLGVFVCVRACGRAGVGL